MCEKEHQEGQEDREIDRYQSIVDRANKEITGVRHVYIWLAGILGLIIIAGITAISLTTWNTIGDMRSDLREETKLITSRLEDEVDLVGRQVTSRIEEEFNKDNIHDLVQTTAKERIDAVADQFISKNVEAKVMPLIDALTIQIEDANDRLTALEDRAKASIKFAEDNLKKQEEVTNYLLTVAAAQNYDRTAYDKLGTWSADKSFFLCDQASAAHTRIMSMHNNPMFQERSISWKAGTDPSKFTLSYLKKQYEGLQVSNSNMKPAMITYIWKREDIPKRDRMEFLIDVLKNDENLKAVEYAGRYFKQGGGLNRNPLAVDEFVSWWEANKDKIE